MSLIEILERFLLKIPILKKILLKFPYMGSVAHAVKDRRFIPVISFSLRCPRFFTVRDDLQGVLTVHTQDDMYSGEFGYAFMMSCEFLGGGVDPGQVRLRTYNIVKFLSYAQHLPGDIVFCGVSHGQAALVTRPPKSSPNVKLLKTIW